MKFNCFFLMPVVDSFPTRLREELEAAFDENLDAVFDVVAVRFPLPFSPVVNLNSPLLPNLCHPNYISPQ